MDVSAVSGPVLSSIPKSSTDVTENWGPDNDGDADDAGLTVKSFSGQPVTRPAGQPAGGEALYL